jgi:triacylglycerol lipase
MAIPKLRAPIVLVHGLLGFDEVRVGSVTLAQYFPRIPQLLCAAGNRILIPRLSPTGGIACRAAQLKAFLDREVPHDPVHLIAHSMGGLDSRYMISRLGMASRVLSLTSLGTPHRGSPFADWGIRRLARLVRPVLQLIGLPTEAFYDLTTAACRAFNEQVPDVLGVRYFSVAGRHDGHYLYPEWLLPYYIVLKEEGPNDGVVSEASARHGEDFEVWDGDHLQLVNWFRPLGLVRGAANDPAPRYSRLIRRLADAGF